MVSASVENPTNHQALTRTRKTVGEWGEDDGRSGLAGDRNVSLSVAATWNLVLVTAPVARGIQAKLLHRQSDSSGRMGISLDFPAKGGYLRQVVTSMEEEENEHRTAFFFDAMATLDGRDPRLLQQRIPLARSGLAPCIRDAGLELHKQQEDPVVFTFSK